MIKTVDLPTLAYSEWLIGKLYNCAPFLDLLKLSHFQSLSEPIWYSICVAQNKLHPTGVDQ